MTEIFEIKPTSYSTVLKHIAEGVLQAIDINLVDPASAEKQLENLRQAAQTMELVVTALERMR